MEGLPKVGDEVAFDDRWFYPGEGIVLEVREKPHHVVYVQVTSIKGERNLHWIGRKTWLLPGHMTVIKKD
jgi:hypothetical protein